MKKFVMYGAAIAMAIAPASVSEAQLWINAEQFRVETTGGPTVVGGSSDQKLAQTFTATRDGYLRILSLPIGCSPTASLTVTISDAPGGMPGTAVLSQQRVSGDVIGGFALDDDDVGFRLIQFDRPARVLSGAQYSYILTASSGSCSVIPAEDGDTYSGGEGWFDSRPNPPGWIRIFPDQLDFAFQVFTTDCRSPVGRCR